MKTKPLIVHLDPETGRVRGGRKARKALAEALLGERRSRLRAVGQDDAPRGSEEQAK